MKTIIVWFRNDLRLHDHPALVTACENAERVIPVFILNDAILHGRHGSPNRNRFLVESLQDLKISLQSKGSDLVVRHGDPVKELQLLIAQTGAEAVYYTADYTPYAIKRDKIVKTELRAISTEFRGFAGRLIVSSFDGLQTKAGTPHKVFTPFYNNWLKLDRRPLAVLPNQLKPLPKDLAIGVMPGIKSASTKESLSPDVLLGGETAARKQFDHFVEDSIDNYQAASNDLAADGTSRLSSYLHFGCLSSREIETLLPDTTGAQAWRRQLAWREFYNYILFQFPTNATEEFQQRFRKLNWGADKALLAAWQQGQTGYPIVDAGMRQLLAQGWMHNRARLIVGSFLTKDLWIDWRLGEAHFMHLLIDGDEASNNGNWQWISSVGVDPAPVFRRLYNPALQQTRHDPSGVYVRRFVPELKDVPDKYLAEPSTMPRDIQIASNCIIGQDYPAPIIDHKQARLDALTHFREASLPRG